MKWEKKTKDTGSQKSSEWEFTNQVNRFPWGVEEKMIGGMVKKLKPASDESPW